MPPKRQKKKSPPKASTTEEAVSGNDASGDVSRSNIITGARTRKGTALSETDGEHITAGRKKSPEVVPKKTRPRAQINSGKSPKRGKADPQSGTDGAAETTSDHNNSLTDRDTDSEHITAGRNDDDAIKGCGDHGRGRFRLPPPPLAA